MDALIPGMCTIAFKESIPSSNLATMIALSSSELTSWADATFGAGTRFHLQTRHCFASVSCDELQSAQSHDVTAGSTSMSAWLVSTSAAPLFLASTASAPRRARRSCRGVRLAAGSGVARGAARRWPAGAGAADAVSHCPALSSSASRSDR